jgi:hypothetical protein
MEGTDMIHRITRVAEVRLLAVAVALLSFTACGGEAAKYSGEWKRDLYGEGEVQMKLASNGGVELMLPSPRWPDSVDMKGRAAFSGDTLIFKADTVGSACQTADARYIGGENVCAPRHFLSQLTGYAATLDRLMYISHHEAVHGVMCTVGGIVIYNDDLDRVLRIAFGERFQAAHDVCLFVICGDHHRHDRTAAYETDEPAVCGIKRLEAKVFKLFFVQQLPVDPIRVFPLHPTSHFPGCYTQSRSQVC